ncbi:helix-turn-helix transcriptional regulator [Mycobacteroides abscessus]
MTMRKDAYTARGRGKSITPSQPPDRGELLTIIELSARLRVSVGCIRAWRLRGEGPPAVRMGSALRWDSIEVDAWIDAQRESRWAAG